ncbi:MAG: 23S rRNA pseudouridine(1911/1915/1917) synthase RluD [Pseudomonadota bacterium]
METESNDLTGIIPESEAGSRLDQSLARMFPDFSRSRLKRWVENGQVTVDGKVPRPRDKVLGGETVQLRPTPEVRATSVPQAIELDVVYEDDSIIVVNKPAGLVVHPGAGNPDRTLENALLHHDGALAALPRAGLVHRLDKLTSGLLVVARTEAAYTALVAAMQERRIKRHYEAVCTGVMTGGGTVDAPLARHPVDRKRMAVRDGGRHAVTHYRVRTRYRGHTHVDVQLETGRTHQIRVHMAHIRYPLVGDPVYGGRLMLPKGASAALTEELRRFRRQALHAARLGLEHPVSGSSMDFEAPLPDDFQNLLAVLAADAPA